LKKKKKKKGWPDSSQTGGKEKRASVILLGRTGKKSKKKKKKRALRKPTEKGINNNKRREKNKNLSAAGKSAWRSGTRKKTNPKEGGSRNHQRNSLGKEKMGVRSWGGGGGGKNLPSPVEKEVMFSLAIRRKKGPKRKKNAKQGELPKGSIWDWPKKKVSMEQEGKGTDAPGKKIRGGKAIKGSCSKRRSCRKK